MMSTEWSHRVYVVGLASAIGGAIQALDAAFPRDDGVARDLATPEKYSVKLSANGNEPASHFGTTFSVTESLRQTLEGMGLANVPGIIYWRTDADSEILQTTNHPASVDAIGQAFSWRDALERLSLQEIAAESPA